MQRHAPPVGKPAKGEAWHVGGDAHLLRAVAEAEGMEVCEVSVGRRRYLASHVESHKAAWTGGRRRIGCRPAGGHPAAVGGRVTQQHVRPFACQREGETGEGGTVNAVGEYAAHDG